MALGCLWVILQWAQGQDFSRRINLKIKMEPVIMTGHVLNVEMSIFRLEQFVI
nr:hypothetical protein Iba_chr15aCG10720 [Ipomoea batatas]